eukprot:g38898.t1
MNPSVLPSIQDLIRKLNTFRKSRISTDASCTSSSRWQSLFSRVQETALASPQPEYASSVSALYICFLGMAQLVQWNHHSSSLRLASSLFFVNGCASVMYHWFHKLWLRFLDGISMVVLAYIVLGVRLEGCLDGKLPLLPDYLFDIFFTFGTVVSIIFSWFHFHHRHKEVQRWPAGARRVVYREKWGVALGLVGTAIRFLTENLCDSSVFFRWLPGHGIFHLLLATGLNNYLLLVVHTLAHTQNMLASVTFSHPSSLWSICYCMFPSLDWQPLVRPKPLPLLVADEPVSACKSVVAEAQDGRGQQQELCGVARLMWIKGEAESKTAAPVPLWPCSSAAASSSCASPACRSLLPRSPLSRSPPRSPLPGSPPRSSLPMSCEREYP